MLSISINDAGQGWMVVVWVCLAGMIVRPDQVRGLSFYGSLINYFASAHKQTLNKLRWTADQTQISIVDRLDQTGFDHASGLMILRILTQRRKPVPNTAAADRDHADHRPQPASDRHRYGGHFAVPRL